MFHYRSSSSVTTFCMQVKNCTNSFYTDLYHHIFCWHQPPLISRCRDWWRPCAAHAHAWWWQGAVPQGCSGSGRRPLPSGPSHWLPAPLHGQCLAKNTISTGFLWKLINASCFHSFWENSIYWTMYEGKQDEGFQQQNRKHTIRGFSLCQSVKE